MYESEYPAYFSEFEYPDIDSLRIYSVKSLGIEYSKTCEFGDLRFPRSRKLQLEFQL